MGEGKRRCRRAPQYKGAGGAHKGHFHIPGVMVVRFKRKAEKEKEKRPKANLQSFGLGQYMLYPSKTLLVR